MSPEVMKHDGYESKSDIWYENKTCFEFYADMIVLFY